MLMCLYSAEHGCKPSCFPMRKIPILASSIPGDEVHRWSLFQPQHTCRCWTDCSLRGQGHVRDMPWPRITRITALVQQHSQAWTFQLPGALRQFQGLESWIFAIPQHKALLWEERKSRECPASRNPQSLCWACRNPVPGSPFARGEHHPNPNPSTSQGIADYMPQLLIYYKICTHIRNNITVFEDFGVYTEMLCISR